MENGDDPQQRNSVPMHALHALEFAAFYWYERIILRIVR
jgi:hypothetical protein